MPATVGGESDNDSEKDYALNEHKLITEIHRTHVLHQRRAKNQSVIQERWDQEKERIGTGTFGSVFLQRRTGTTDVRAVKKLSKDNWGSLHGSVQGELTHLISVMDRPDLFVKFLGWYENDDFVFYTMGYMEHGDLGKFMEAHKIQVRRQSSEIGRQVLEGLAVLHKRKICHRDLKPQNILIACLSPLHVKLADFGIAKCEIGTAMMTTGVGTMGYIAPEVLRFVPQGSAPRRQYSNAIDMWAFGCLIHTMLTMEQPFSLDGMFDMRIFVRFCGGDTDLSVARIVGFEGSTCARDFLKQLLVLDGFQRVSALEALDNHWIKGCSCMLLKPTYTVAKSSTCLKDFRDPKKLVSQDHRKPTSQDNKTTSSAEAIQLRLGGQTPATTEPLESLEPKRKPARQQSGLTILVILLVLYYICCYYLSIMEMEVLAAGLKSERFSGRFPPGF